ncbi:MAG: glycosyltransferase [Syntrophomonadaceae bacterium]|nr:glycosyltransferase [Syntrophomonadaceae bacterium]
MRVLHIINSLQVGGAETLLVNLVSALRESGCEVSIHALQRTDSVLEYRAKGIFSITFAEGRLRSPLQVDGLRRRLGWDDYDVIHVHLFPAQLWVPIALRTARRRTLLITTEHSTHNHRRKALLRPVDRWMYMQYAAIVCVSDAVQRSLQAWVPQTEGIVHVIPNGIPVSQFGTATALTREALVGSGGGPIVLSVARFEEEKDHATLLRAMRRLEDAHLVLVGDGSTRPLVESQVVSMGLKDRVHFLGRRSDVARIMKACDVYVQSSRWEGFSLSVVEAMASGLPVVASAVPGLRETVGEAGILFPAGDDERLAQELKRVLSNSAMREELRERGFKRVVNFDISHTAQAHLTLYQRILQGS